jgi:outer membrane protein OmpA-like peptidoglycan-associated protein
MKKAIQITAVLLFTSLTIFGQTKETKKADIHFENLSFLRASEAYKELAEKNPTEHVLKRLGDSYYANVDMKNASLAYANLFSKYKPEDTEYMFKYAQSLRAIGNFDDSKSWMKKFNDANKNDSRGGNFTDEKADLSKLTLQDPSFQIKNLKAINSVNSDFGVTEYGNTILFSSPNRTSRFIKTSHTRNDKNFLDIFKVQKDKLEASEIRPLFSEDVNTKFHESSVTFSPDRKTMYFTRNNYVSGKYSMDKKGYNNLVILQAKWLENKWGDIKELPFCSRQYSVGHPSVSKDGKRLYFTSDMPGSIGKTDIYYVTIKDNDAFGPIQNLGIEVNTEGREMFPFIADDGTLYFSSDGHFGIGALDIFSSKQENGFFKKPVNLKAPINSELDDFAFSINNISNTGYLSSNRKGGVGDDDIYSFVKTPIKKEIVIVKEEKCLQNISGIVRESKFKNHLANAALILKNSSGLIIKDTIADNLGRFSFSLPCNESYTITASKEYFKPDTASFETTQAVSVKLDLDFALEIVDDFEYNSLDELVIKIRPIYFDYNKWSIRKDAANELDIIANIMQKYPKLIVTSTSHTDARGKSSYNLSLSEKRAQSTVKYLLEKGINSDRISGEGFGETKLTNKCVDNDAKTNTVNCTDEEHQANRRTEFIILNVNNKPNSKTVSSFYSSKNSKKAINGIHVVKEDQTLYFISNLYNLTLEQLKKLNNLKSDKLIVGQSLKIK